MDGPHHFTANTLAVTGEMLARQKLLRARGWHIISVPFFRWAGRSDEARAQWLLQVRPLPTCPSKKDAVQLRNPKVELDCSGCCRLSIYTPL